MWESNNLSDVLERIKTNFIINDFKPEKNSPENEAEKKLAAEISEKIKSFVGGRFLNEKLENFQGSQKNDVKSICENIRNFIESGHSLLIIGSRGTGKTLTARHILENALINKRTVYYSRVQTLLLDIFDNRSISEKCKSVSLLILDEVGKTSGAERSTWELSRMLEILDYRHANKKSTILISNLAEKELVNYIGLDMLDRMKEKEWRKLIFSGESLRGKE